MFIDLLQFCHLKSGYLEDRLPGLTTTIFQQVYLTHIEAINIIGPLHLCRSILRVEACRGRQNFKEIRYILIAESYNFGLPHPVAGYKSAALGRMQYHSVGDLVCAALTLGHAKAGMPGLLHEQSCIIHLL